jgi:hypothetical protein
MRDDAAETQAGTCPVVNAALKYPCARRYAARELSTLVAPSRNEGLLKVEWRHFEIFKKFAVLNRTHRQI